MQRVVVKGGGFELVLGLKRFNVLKLAEMFLLKDKEVSVANMCGMVGIEKVI